METSFPEMALTVNAKGLKAENSQLPSTPYLAPDPAPMAPLQAVAHGRGPAPPRPNRQHPLAPGPAPLAPPQAEVRPAPRPRPSSRRSLPSPPRPPHGLPADRAAPAQAPPPRTERPRPQAAWSGPRLYFSFRPESRKLRGAVGSTGSALARGGPEGLCCRGDGDSASDGVSFRNAGEAPGPGQGLVGACGLRAGEGRPR